MARTGCEPWAWLRETGVAVFAGLCLVVAGCAAPVKAVRVDPTVAHRELARSAVTTGEASWPTRDALLERGLYTTFEPYPEETLAALHGAMVAEDGNPDLLFALAELSFLHGEKAGKPGHQMAAAVYAWAFLFPEDESARPDPFDPRFRAAADLYNLALTGAFASSDGSDVVPRGGTFALPFASLDVAFDPGDLRAGNREMYDFVPAAELEVEGLAMRYRWPGIGAPLAAATRPGPDAKGSADMVAPRLRVPVTALLRIDDARRALVKGRALSARLELYLAWDAESVTIGDRTVPLESEPTAALALTFTGIPIAELELIGFLGRLSGLAAERPPLVSATPYKSGLIPVVFVHGTASSIVRWAELYNRLQADPELRDRYQFWFFQYDSDAPIALSALRLRDALDGAVERLDPQGRDPALNQMVLVGHSQGGLLVKMQAVDSGDAIWNAVSSKPIEEIELSDSTRALLKRGLFVEPLPHVARVVFISTPHRGSFIAGSRIVLNLTRWLTSLPTQLTGVSAEIARTGAARSPFVPTAVDNMSPDHPFIRGLQSVPVSPDIPAHSIISVEGDGPVEEGDDGVVAYTSAHIEEAGSEKVVRSPHSCQGHPDTIEEVRRILRLHAAGIQPGGGGGKES